MSAEKEVAIIPLDEREEIFVTEYLVDLNASRSARAAGHNEAGSRVAGHKILAKPHVQAEIQRRMKERMARTTITADRVLKEFARLAFSDMRKIASWTAGSVSFIPSETLSEDDAACVKEISETTTEDGGSMKIKLHDKLPALVWVARHIGLGDPKTGKDPLENMTDAEKIKALEEALVFMKGGKK